MMILGWLKKSILTAFLRVQSGYNTIAIVPYFWSRIAWGKSVVRRGYRKWRWGKTACFSAYFPNKAVAALSKQISIPYNTGMVLWYGAIGGLAALKVFDSLGFRYFRWISTRFEEAGNWLFRSNEVETWRENPPKSAPGTTRPALY